MLLSENTWIWGDNDEFEAYEKEGLLKCCNAWSRDQDS